MPSKPFALLAPWAIGLLAGCLTQDKCEVGTGYCQGDVAMVCDPPCADLGCHAFYVEEPCHGRVCVEDGDAAFCALSAEKRAQCEPYTESYCDGSRVTWCNQGYAVSSSDCAEMGRACADAQGVAFCALSSLPDERCGVAAGSPYSLGHTCDELHRLECRFGFLVRDEVCSIACAEYQFGANCSLMAGPDPRCAEGAELNDGDRHCVEDRSIQCENGLSVLKEDCRGWDGICVDESLRVRCEFPLPPEQTAEARGEDPGVNEQPRELSAIELDPRCPGELSAAVCDGQRWVVCEDGRATQERQCTHACVAVMDGAFCTLADGSDERCASDQPDATRAMPRCAGDVQFFCSEGRALEHLDCRVLGQVCVPAVEGRSAYCAPPDARAN